MEISNGSVKFAFPRVELDGKVLKNHFNIAFFTQKGLNLLPQAEMFGHPLAGRDGKFPRFDVAENTRGQIDPDGFYPQNLGAGLFIFHLEFQRGDRDGTCLFQAAAAGERYFNFKGERPLMEEL